MMIGINDSIHTNKDEMNRISLLGFVQVRWPWVHLQMQEGGSLSWLTFLVLYDFLTTLASALYHLD
jgi:hypothetical protein